MEVSEQQWESQDQQTVEESRESEESWDAPRVRESGQSREVRSRIEAICDEVIEEKRWRPFKDREIAVVEQENPFFAFISLQDYRIHIHAHPQLLKIVEGMVADLKIPVDVANAVDCIIYYLLVHEYDHYHYCPSSPFHFEQIIAGIRSFVEKKEYRESVIQRTSFEIQNFFSDTVIDTIASHDPVEFDRSRYRLGQDLATLVTVYHKKKAHKGWLPLRFDKATLLFARSKLHLCDTNKELYARLKKYLPRIWWGEEQVVSELVRVFVPDRQLAARVLASSLSDADSPVLRKLMCEYDAWPSQAARYAALIYPYMKREHDWLKNPFSGSAGGCGGSCSAPSQSGGSYNKGNPNAGRSSATASAPPGSQYNQGKKGGGAKGKGDGKGEGAGENGDGGDGGSAGDGEDTIPRNQDNLFRKKGGSGSRRSDSDRLRDEPARSEMQRDAHQGRQPAPRQQRPPEPAPFQRRQHSPYGFELEPYKADTSPWDYTPRRGGNRPGFGKGIGIGTGVFHPMKYNFAQVDALYRERAGNIQFISDLKTPENLELWKVVQQTDDFDSRRVDWPSTILIRRPGRSPVVQLSQKTFPLSIDAKVMQNLGGLLDMVFVFDCSGSMGFDPYGGHGEYHIAVQTFYSIVAGLEKRGIAPVLKYFAVSFSDVTRSSGWKHYRELDDVKRTMFNYQGGGTTISIKDMRAIRTERKDSYIMFFLSDLCISNIRELEEELVTAHHARVGPILVFKLGGKDITCERLESHGIQILYPRDAMDFMYESIRITDKLYQGVV